MLTSEHVVPQEVTSVVCIEGFRLAKPDGSHCLTEFCNYLTSIVKYVSGAIIGENHLGSFVFLTITAAASASS